MPTLINPFREKADRDARDAIIMDIKNLARTLYIQNEPYTPAQAFGAAVLFIEEQSRRFPKNDTLDGRSKE